MNNSTPNHFWALLKPFSILILWITTGIVAYFAIFNWFIFGKVHSPEYSLNGYYSAYMYVMLVCFGYEYTLGGNLFQQKGNAAIGMLSQQIEFLFTRAISRESIYWAKFTTYLMGVTLPILAISIWTLTQPVAKIQLSYDAKEREKQQAFYTQNFDHVQIIGNQDARFAVIPQGRQAKATVIVLNILAFAVVYQFIQHLTRHQVWVQRGMYMACIMSPGFWPLLSSKLFGPEQNDDFCLTWIYHHWAIYATLLLIVGACVQYVCHRTFMQQELE